MSPETNPGMPNYMNGETYTDIDAQITEPETDTVAPATTPVQSHADTIDDIRSERNAGYGYGGENFGV